MREPTSCFCISALKSFRWWQTFSPYMYVAWMNLNPLTCSGRIQNKFVFHQFNLVKNYNNNMLLLQWGTSAKVSIDILKWRGSCWPHPGSAIQTISYQNGGLFIWLIVYFAYHHMSEWICVQTLQQAVSGLPAADILLELPLRMFSSKHMRPLI